MPELRGRYVLQRAGGFCFHSQTIQSTFLGSPPKSFSRVMHWPRWCCVCIATCTRASATEITHGGSGNQGTRTVADRDSGRRAAAKSRRPVWLTSARAFKSANDGGGP